MRVNTRLWLILCTLSPLVAALPSPRGLLHLKNDLSVVSKNSAQHELVAHLVYYLRKHAVSAILRLEVFTIGSGNHFTIPASDTKDEDLHRKARALARMWTRLATMERMDSIINNATVEVALHSADDFPNQKIIEALFENIEQRLKTKPNLYRQYRAFQNTSATVGHSCKLFFKVEDFSDDQYEDAFMDWIVQPTMKKYFVNKLFLQQSVRGKNENPHELEYFKIAKSLMRLAQNENWTSTAQRVFDETIDEIAEDFSVMEHPYESNSRIFKNYGYELRVDRTTSKLFHRLIEKCRLLPELNDHLREIKKKLDDEKNAENQPNRVINVFPL